MYIRGKIEALLLVRKMRKLLRNTDGDRGEARRVEKTETPKTPVQTQKSGATNFTPFMDVLSCVKSMERNGR